MAPKPSPRKRIEVLADQVESVAVSSLRPHPNNANQHPEEQVKQLAESYREFGFTGVVLRDEQNQIVAGEGRWLAAKQVGMSHIPSVQTRGWSAEKVRAYMLADNQIAKNSVLDTQILARELGHLTSVGLDVRRLGFSSAQLAKHMRTQGSGKTEADEAPELPATPTTRPGDMWQLGKHAVGCLDSTDRDAVAALLTIVGKRVDLLMMDPPYCSGGFQEAGRRAGSIGTRGDETIANDTLSTRGYQALIKSVLERWAAGSVYVFTDWRMWLALFDVVESSGYGVRNMIVWDKETPGMGAGWRMQHELIMAATRVKQPFDPKQAQGNVVRAKRTGNILHPTQKPVDLLRTMLGVSDFAEVVADPFMGSGSTLIAAHEVGRTFIGCDLDPAFVDVAVQRWQEFTGEAAVLVRKGAQRLTFDEARNA